MHEKKAISEHNLEYIPMHFKHDFSQNLLFCPILECVVKIKIKFVNKQLLLYFIIWIKTLAEISNISDSISF